MCYITSEENVIDCKRHVSFASFSQIPLGEEPPQARIPTTQKDPGTTTDFQASAENHGEKGYQSPAWPTQPSAVLSS